MDEKKMLDHENWHKGIKPHKCSWCDKSYQNFANLSAHQRALHLDLYRLHHKEKVRVQVRNTWRMRFAVHFQERAYALFFRHMAFTFCSTISGTLHLRFAINVHERSIFALFFQSSGTWIVRCAAHFQRTRHFALCNKS
jgi:hypothetical protein